MSFTLVIVKNNIILSYILIVIVLIIANMLIQLYLTKINYPKSFKLFISGFFTFLSICLLKFCFKLQLKELELTIQMLPLYLQYLSNFYYLTQHDFMVGENPLGSNDTNKVSFSTIFMSDATSNPVPVQPVQPVASQPDSE